MKMYTPSDEVYEMWLRVSKNYTLEQIEKGSGLTYRTVCRALERKPVKMSTHDKLNEFFIVAEKKRKDKERKLASL